ncbi:putative lipid A biosynthesis lauroyl acyltransferase [Frigidibacter mobilis]|uniref:Putative lipid A biosynthesis lauroyl acyltransferase n=1 Tax=Frigidibacter mobilis TaxID=1335048 RepID=A0A159Z1S7_9RHOB|nr:putative lipid A biosynthesis lauroyl acyltransferase [Frigidibacter mobilis]
MARRRKSRAETAGDWLSDRAVRLLIGSALRLPYARRLALVGWAMRRVVAPLAGYRARALANLAHVFPNMSLAERRRIATAVAENVGRTLIENYSGTEFTTRMAQLPLQGRASPRWRRRGRPGSR